MFFPANSTGIARARSAAWPRERDEAGEGAASFSGTRKPHLYSVDGASGIRGRALRSRRMRCFKKRKGVNADGAEPLGKGAAAVCLRQNENPRVVGGSRSGPAYFICRGLFCLAPAILLPYFSHNASACMSLISRDATPFAPWSPLFPGCTQRQTRNRSRGRWRSLTSYHSLLVSLGLSSWGAGRAADDEKFIRPQSCERSPVWVYSSTRGIQRDEEVFRGFLGSACSDEWKPRTP